MPTDNTLEALREQLFATIRDLRDPAKPMDIERGRAISDVARRVIESAKVEVDYVKATGREDLRLPVMGDKAEPLAGVKVHRIK